ncbi:hypothetical protein KKF61_07875 [Patescibacteria group bacterium]|nr:hypothetical protein [Patescibacteria group bacterium]
MKPKSKPEKIYWLKLHGHHNDDEFNYEKRNKKIHKKNKKRLCKAIRRNNKIIIKKGINYVILEY